MLFIVHTVPDGGKVIFYRFVACTEPLEWLKSSVWHDRKWPNSVCPCMPV